MKLLAEQIQQARHENQTLQIVGGNSKVPLNDTAQVLSIQEHSGILSYEPAELVITARAGTRLQELQQVLAEKKQMLAFEPPEYGNSTIGGTYACALTGPARPFRGKLRDYVLGTKLLDGQGRALSFGGKMIKNVAGYDVSRMLAGSKGSMALVTELSLKVVPLVEEVTYRIEMPECEAIVLMNQLAGTSLPLSGAAYYGGYFYYRVMGAHPKQTNRVGVEAVDNQVWQTLNPFRPKLPPGQKLWRLDVESTTPCIDGTIAVGMCGSRRWVASEHKPEHPYVTLWDERFLPRHNDGLGVQKIKQGLKKVFDPYHVFQDL
ncbi:MAG: glycolate oxidase subunit GlcE [Thiotrichales bacterium]|nr:glycolate oxidase subunit GlcE [Thiotrichales bacterium]